MGETEFQQRSSAAMTAHIDAVRVDGRPPIRLDRGSRRSHRAQARSRIEHSPRWPSVRRWVVLSRAMASPTGFVPRRRPHGLVTEQLEGETLLYVEETHRAFCLNPSAARVWDAIDGRRDVSAISRQVDLDADLVIGTLQEMGGAGLLASVGGLSVSSVDLSRRRLVRA